MVSSLKETNPNIVLGIKEPPLAEVPLPSSSQQAPARPPTHLMFSHTAKGQEYNMPLLARFVAPSSASAHTKQHFPRLIDYELLTNDNGKRTVGFGWFAGAAGVLESLAAMAQHHLEMGIASPFLVCPFFLYPTSASGSLFNSIPLARIPYPPSRSFANHCVI